MPTKQTRQREGKPLVRLTGWTVDYLTQMSVDLSDMYNRLPVSHTRDVLKEAHDLIMEEIEARENES